MFSDIRIAQAVKPNTVIVPSTAISYSLYGNAIYVIEKSKKDKNDPKGKDVFTVNRVFVTTGEQQGNYTVVKKGIKAGQMVVTAGDLKLQNGTEIVINNDISLNTISNPDDLSQ